MSFEVSWIVPRRVILLRLSGDGDNDMIASDVEILGLMEDADPKAHLIHQIIYVDNFTGNTSIKALTAMKSPKHPLLGTVVAVGIPVNPLMRMAGKLAAQMLRVKLVHRHTMEEALETLYHIDATLPKEFAPERFLP